MRKITPAQMLKIQIEISKYCDDSNLKQSLLSNSKLSKLSVNQASRVIDLCEDEQWEAIGGVLGLFL